jgi:hypothetical protein
MGYRLGIALAALAGLLATGLVAQSTTALLLGTVLDPSSAPVPDAKVTVTNVGTGVSRVVSTGSRGDYAVPDLPYGTYTVTAIKTGFAQLVRTGIVLNAGDRRTVDLNLTVGTVTESVNVSGSTPLLRQADASLGQAISNKILEEMPVLGRSFDQILYLVPGSQVSPTGQYGANSLMTAGPAIGVSFNGMRTEMNAYELDGTQLNNPVFGTPSIYPSVETLQEVRVETQNFSTELSRTAGGQVLLVSKSGTNEWHGSAYEYLQNSDLNARNPFALVRPTTRSNQFGGTLGGPIIHNNTFFFLGYEGFRGIVPGTSSTTVPTDSQRQGILNDPVLDPKPIIDPLTGQPFPHNIIPSNMLSPIALNVLKISPEPNTPGFPNYTQDVSTTHSFDQANVRADHYFGSFGRLFGRWTYQPTDILSPAFVTVDTPVTHGSGQNIVIGFDANSAHFFNAIRFGHTRFDDLSPNTAPPNITPQTLGFPLDEFQANPGGQWYGIPNFQISNYASGFNGFGQATGTPIASKIRHFEISDNMTLVKGSHTFAWGGSYTRSIIIQLSSQDERGQYGFDGTYTGDSLADFLLGLPRNLSRTTLTPEPIEHENLVYSHFSDTWRPRPNLTIDYGLAYSYNGQPWEVANRVQSFFVGPVDGVPRIQFVQGGDPRFPARSCSRTYWTLIPGLELPGPPSVRKKPLFARLSVDFTVC